jgi:3'-phosphoadenosine 5'-phosphosulfate sulfotransferase (PAPS reductase)/FAD synthetase
METMKERHILSLSGGKDSAALAVYMQEKYPSLPLEYVFVDSGHELPETYDFINKMKAILGITITEIKPKRNFEYWLQYFNGVLPSPNNRWCTRLLKLKPYQAWIDKNCKNQKIYSYVGLRADEDREGYQSKIESFKSIHPFVDDGLVLKDIKNILHISTLGLPEYYTWRKRSGCFFCFYQSVDEWLGLKQNHPDLFEKACRYEENHSDGRIYTWRDTKNKELAPLRSLVKQKKRTMPKIIEKKHPLLSDSLENIISAHDKPNIGSILREKGNGE